MKVFYRFASSNSETIRVVNPETADVNSGINDYAPLPEIQTIGCLEILESDIVLDYEDMAVLPLLVNPLHEDNEHGKQLYVNACETFKMILFFNE